MKLPAKMPSQTHCRPLHFRFQLGNPPPPIFPLSLAAPEERLPLVRGLPINTWAPPPPPPPELQGCLCHSSCQERTGGREAQPMRLPTQVGSR